MWKETNNALVKEFTFNDFKEAFAFMTKVAEIANAMDHHPSWSNLYNKVTITLSTHDAGDIVTDKDRDMAEQIDELAKLS